jgi:cation transport regulator ChaB
LCPTSSCRHTKNDRNQLTGWPKSVLKAIDRHLQDMFDAIFVSAFQRLHRAKERENLFNGEQGGLVIDSDIVC